MSGLVVVAHFIALMNGVPVHIESVTLEGPSCPKVSSALPPSQSGVPDGSCEGMVLEGETLRFWTLALRDANHPRSGWRGWQTRVLARDVDRLLTGTPPRIEFPHTSLSFEQR
ncbi:MAG: hypothetical protein RLY30_1562 [Pseudomonadota bacterium]|jgi:hypothetical protein